jgi:XTP/dITP diphosphohydrolase
VTLPAHIVLATGNLGKVVELRALLESWGPLTVTSLAEHPGLKLPEETGATYAENAAIKACAVAVAVGMPALADDSGIEVDALGGAPGIRSARWAPTDEERIATMLRALASVSDRTARFHCAMALAWPDGRVEAAEGTCRGRIAVAPTGGGGFGYDPIFVSDELETTFAIASADDKARVGHRGRAVRALEARLRGA